jgi:hypothetical protein
MQRRLLGELVGPERNSPARGSCPATQLRIRRCSRLATRTHSALSHQCRARVARRLTHDPAAAHGIGWLLGEPLPLALQHKPTWGAAPCREHMTSTRPRQPTTAAGSIPVRRRGCCLRPSATRSASSASARHGSPRSWAGLSSSATPRCGSQCAASIHTAVPATARSCWCTSEWPSRSPCRSRSTSARPPASADPP